MFANKDQEALDRLKEEAYYERALEELSQGVKRQGLWLKAMTLSEGDENKARLKYIQLAIQAYKDEDHISARLAENGQGAAGDLRQQHLPPGGIQVTANFPGDLGNTAGG